MKKLVLFLILLANLSFAGINATFGSSPSRGILSIGYVFPNEQISVNVHVPFYDSDYDFVGGIGVSYHFFGKTGPYAFHSSEWINGTISGFSYTINRNKTSDIRETSRDINYWRLVFGFGYQHMFTTHVGAYFEAGFEFFAGNGGYYTHFDADKATLDNDEIRLPAGFGLVISF